MVKLGLSKMNVDEYNETVLFLKEILDITANIRIGPKGYWKPLQTGILLATKGVLDLQDRFLSSHNFKYVLLSRFTQDALENLFSNVRSRNPVPNAKEFKTALRLISVSQYFTQPKHGNYGVTDDIPLVNFLSREDGENSIDVESFGILDSTVTCINVEETESLFYLLGSVLKNIKTNQLHCSNCISSVTTENMETVEEFNLW